VKIVGARGGGVPDIGEVAARVCTIRPSPENRQEHLLN
jgi:hypothetical protein